MSDYRKSKQHIEGVQNQKNNAEARCANQRKQLALMNAQIKNYKELLRDLRDEADGALQAIQKDCESDDWSIFNYPEVQYLYDLLTKIDNAIGEK